MTKPQIRNLHPMFGAEVVGFEPGSPLDEATCRTLRNVFDERGLLLFRDLDIDLAYQNYLSQMLIGTDPASIDTSVVPDNVPEYYVSNKEERGGAPFGRLLFHSDMMWSENAFQLLSLYGSRVEQPAVPTLFVSATHAWDTLPDDLRARVKGRLAVHGHDATYRKRGGENSDVLVSKFAVNETAQLPIGHRHPRTGRTMLYICQQMTQGIADASEEESEELLEALFEHLYSPEDKVLAHHWREGDLVLWDNLALQHARPNVSIEGPTRTLRKTFAPPPPRSDRINKPQHSLVGNK
jgi:alpha-ketoglutarate-dependent taurine dioxygenase